MIILLALVGGSVLFGRMFFKTCQEASTEAEAASEPAPAERPRALGDFPTYGRPQDTTTDRSTTP